MRVLFMLSVFTSVCLVSGCGEHVPSEREFKQRLVEISKSAAGRDINIPKELDIFRTLSDGEKIRLYKSLREGL